MRPSPGEMHLLMHGHWCAAVLMGPVRATTYLLVYGVLSLSLAVCWALRLPWVVSIPLGALARIGGYLAYIALSSWVTNENL